MITCPKRLIEVDLPIKRISAHARREKSIRHGHISIIQSIAPGYKFDALLRRRDTDRYDDRLTVRTNLIDAFDLLMGFIEKHLDDYRG